MGNTLLTIMASIGNPYFTHSLGNNVVFFSRSRNGGLARLFLDGANTAIVNIR